MQCVACDPDQRQSIDGAIVYRSHASEILIIAAWVGRISDDVPIKEGDFQSVSEHRWSHRLSKPRRRTSASLYGCKLSSFLPRRAYTGALDVQATVVVFSDTKLFGFGGAAMYAHRK
ncbi:unnamed protein product [Bursaphelenchus xylophilus]|uniref:(pine wood nematode) hypothetical protein n=1 Tax=Bursaphelenchus xylophilus TaxID=6326 RepID=A0A7I8WGJ5_BURXY|nr:unnamed protein product [Bursaphelenchus xylophilus]CAG9110964.1 unnamed protein product [Bursaphelenchus xylophilus]